VAPYGDADLNNAVDVADLSAWNNNFASGNHWAQGDFNYDGAVDIGDLSIWSNNFAGTLAFGGAAAAPAAAGITPLTSTARLPDSPTGRRRHSMPHSHGAHVRALSKIALRPRTQPAHEPARNPAIAAWFRK
jgi:hypothetical protein